MLTSSTITCVQARKSLKCEHSSIILPKPRWDYQVYNLLDMYCQLENQGVSQMSTQWFFTFFVTELLRVPVIATKELQPPILDLHDAYAPLVRELVGITIIHKTIS